MEGHYVCMAAWRNCRWPNLVEDPERGCRLELAGVEAWSEPQKAYRVQQSRGPARECTRVDSFFNPKIVSARIVPGKPRTDDYWISGLARRRPTRLCLAAFVWSDRRLTPTLAKPVSYAIAIAH